MEQIMEGRRYRRRRGPSLLTVLALVSAAIIVVGGTFLRLSGGAGAEPTPTPAVATPDWVTEELLPMNPYSRPGDPLEEVNGVVVHYVGNPGTTAAQNHRYFAGLADTGETYASSHFLVGLEGEVIQNIPLDEIAYATGSRNSDTVSIEVCHPDDTGEFTPESYRVLVDLVNWLREVYSLDTSQVIRHYDATGKECPRYYVRHPEAWENFLRTLEE